MSTAGSAVRVRVNTAGLLRAALGCGDRYEVEPVDAPIRVVVQSELLANEPAPAQSADPRAAAVLESPLAAEESSCHELRVVLVHSTRRSKLGLAAGMDHVVNGPDGTDAVGESEGTSGA